MQSVQVTIPANLQQQVEDLVAQMSGAALEEAAADVDIEFEVDKILSHRTSGDGRFIWKVRFKDGVVQEIEDDAITDPKCLVTILEYCHLHNIRTVNVLCRVSTKHQAREDAVSLEAQEEAILAWCRKEQEKARAGEPSQCHPGDRIKVIRLTRSAYSSIPPTVSAVSTSGNSGDRVITLAVDRLARNIVTFFSLMDQAATRGVGFYAIHENLDWAANKTEFIEAIIVSQRESEAIGRRVRASVRYRLSQGHRLGRAPYGSRAVRDAQGRRVFIRDEEQTAIIAYATTALREGRTPRQIAEALNEAGRLNGRKPWTAARVTYIIKRNR